jgi:two-component system, NarL family, nitrate/nitrite response regulator NarL
MRILLAADQSLFREAIGFALSSSQEMEVVAECDYGRDAIEAAERRRPDVAFVDAELPPSGGVLVGTAIIQRVPECRVVILSPTEDAMTLMEAVVGGAVGYLTRSVHLAELLETARAVNRGEAVIPPALLPGLLTQLVKRSRDEDEALERLAKLTKREREVLALLSRGADNRSIAAELVISSETARTHIQNVLAKLGVHSRIEAAAFVGNCRAVAQALDGIVPAHHPYLEPVADSS